MSSKIEATRRVTIAPDGVQGSKVTFGYTDEADLKRAQSELEKLPADQRGTVDGIKLAARAAKLKIVDT